MIEVLAQPTVVDGVEWWYLDLPGVVWLGWPENELPAGFRGSVRYTAETLPTVVADLRSAGASEVPF